MQQQSPQRPFSLQSTSINFQAPRQNAPTQKVQSNRAASQSNGKTQQILDQLNSFVASQHTQQESSEKMQQRCTKQEQVLGVQRSQIQELRSERAKITEQLRLQEATVEEVELQAVTYKNQFHALQKSMHQSKAKIDAGESKVAEIGSWKDEVDARLAKMQSTVRETLTRNNRKQEELTNERAILQTEVDSLNSKMETMSREKADLAASNASKDSQLNQEAERIEHLKTEAASLKTRVEELDSSYQQAREREAALLSKIGLLDKRIEEMKFELRESAATIKSQKKDWQAELKRHEHASFADKAKMAEAHRAEKAASEDALKTTRHECEMKEAVAKEKITHLQQMEQASAEKIKTMSTKIDTLAQECDAQKAQIEQTKRSHEAHDVQLTRRCAELEASVHNVASELNLALERARSQNAESAAKINSLEEQLKAAKASAVGIKDQERVMEERGGKLQEECEAHKATAEKFKLEAQDLTAIVSDKEKALQSAEERWNEKLRDNMIKSQEYFAKCQNEMKAQHDAETMQMKASQEQLEQKVTTMEKELETANVALQGVQEASSKQKTIQSQKEKSMASRIEELEKELQASKKLQAAKELQKKSTEMIDVSDCPAPAIPRKGLFLPPSDSSKDRAELQRTWFPPADAGDLEESISSSHSAKVPPSKHVNSRSLDQSLGEEPSSAARTKKGSASFLKPKSVSQARFGPEPSPQVANSAQERGGPDRATLFEIGKSKGKTERGGLLRTTEFHADPRTPARTEDAMVFSLSQTEDPSVEKTIKKRKRNIDGPRSTSGQGAKKAESQPVRQASVSGFRPAKVPVRYGSLAQSAVPAKASLKKSATRKPDSRPDPRLSPAGSERSIDLFSQGAC